MPVLAELAPEQARRLVRGNRYIELAHESGGARYVQFLHHGSEELVREVKAFRRAMRLFQGLLLALPVCRSRLPCGRDTHRSTPSWPQHLFCPASRHCSYLLLKECSIETTSRLLSQRGTNWAGHCKSVEVSLTHRCSRRGELEVDQQRIETPLAAERHGVRRSLLGRRWARRLRSLRPFDSSWISSPPRPLGHACGTASLQRSALCSPVRGSHARCRPV